MMLTAKEMEVLCVFHAGTVSATLDILRELKNESGERMVHIKSVIEKLSGLKAGESVSLAFEPE